jgi:hypothetical protein
MVHIHILIVSAVLRPQYESELTIQDRTASLFFADLIHLYSEILPPLVERKKRESERVMPTRKRTTIVDQRISRSSLTDGADPQELLGLQHLKQNPPRSSSPEPSSAPPAPIAEEQTQGGVEEQPTAPATATLTTSYDLSAQDKVIASGAANLSRTGSGETSRLRGPRGKLHSRTMVVLTIRCPWSTSTSNSGRLPHGDR